MNYIGDIHGDFQWYEKTVADLPYSVQVGDFGAGFGQIPVVNQNHRFIRGNHDDPSICKQIQNWIPDGHFQDGILYIGGAHSIDKQFRTPGLNWWPDEELRHDQFDDIIAAAKEQKPHTVVSHDGPIQALDVIFGSGLKIFASRTQINLQTLWDCVPSIKTWIHGHWHENVDEIVNGTRFVCVGINQIKWVD